jgi:hypothetical protein
MDRVILRNRPDNRFFISSDFFTVCPFTSSIISPTTKNYDKLYIEDFWLVPDGIISLIAINERVETPVNGLPNHSTPLTGPSRVKQARMLHNKVHRKSYQCFLVIYLNVTVTKSSNL